MSAARDIKGPWLSAPPQLRRPFDQSRDPLIEQQIADLEKTESQRREESAAGGYKIPRKTDKPAPELKPPRHLRGDADREGWLAARRDAALARAAIPDTATAQDRERHHQPARVLTGPSL